MLSCWESSRFRGAVAVAVPSAVMLALGLWGLDRGGMWRDEAVTFQVARRSVPQIWRLVHVVDVVHGLYYLLMHAVLAVRADEVLLRLPSVCAAALTAGLVAALGTRLARPRVGLWAGLLYAVTPMSGHYAQEGRSYALVAAGATGATLLFVRAMTAGGRSWWAYGAVVGVTCWLHEFAVMLLLAHAVTLALARAPWRVWRGWASAAGAIVLALVPVVLVSRAQSAQLAWVREPGADSAEWLAREFLGQSEGVYRTCLALAVLGVSRTLGRRGEPTGAGVALPLLTVPPAALMTASLLTPLYVDRYVLYALAGAPLLTALGAERLTELGAERLTALATRWRRRSPHPGRPTAPYHRPYGRLPVPPRRLPEPPLLAASRADRLTRLVARLPRAFLSARHGAPKAPRQDGARHHSRPVPPRRLPGVPMPVAPAVSVASVARVASGAVRRVGAVRRTGTAGRTGTVGRWPHRTLSTPLRSSSTDGTPLPSSPVRLPRPHPRLLASPLVTATGVLAVALVLLLQLPVLRADRLAGTRPDNLAALAALAGRELRPGDPVLFLPAQARSTALAYPARFRGTRDVALARTAADSGTLYGREVGEQTLRHRLAGLDRVWVVAERRVLDAPRYPGDPTERAKLSVVEEQFTLREDSVQGAVAVRLYVRRPAIRDPEPPGAPRRPAPW